MSAAVDSNIRKTHKFCSLGTFNLIGGIGKVRTNYNLRLKLVSALKNSVKQTGFALDIFFIQFGVLLHINLWL